MNDGQHNRRQAAHARGTARDGSTPHRGRRHEARRRRDLIGAALRKEFPGSRTYINGSIAHGDVLTPLNDVDLGVVVKGAEQTYGPGKRGPQELEDRAAEAIRTELKGAFPGLVVTVKGQKRAVLVRFGDPVTPGQPDFTSDVIVAIDVPESVGLWIPCGDDWDRSHPEGHTAVVRTANQRSHASYAQVVRLLKHWNRKNQKPLCSWNIKALALALGCLTQQTSMLEGLRKWFDYAHDQLSRYGETRDPAGVAPEAIHLNEPMDVVLGRAPAAGTDVQRRERPAGAFGGVRRIGGSGQAGYRPHRHGRLQVHVGDPGRRRSPWAWA